MEYPQEEQGQKQAEHHNTPPDGPSWTGKLRGEKHISTLLTKTTRKGKAIAETLTQNDDRDRISITVDGEPVGLDEGARASRPVSLGPG